MIRVGRWIVEVRFESEQDPIAQRWTLTEDLAETSGITFEHLIETAARDAYRRVSTELTMAAMPSR